MGLSSERTVAVIGAALDLGQGRRGVDMGPSAIRYAGLADRLALLGYRVHDRGNVVAAEPEATALVDEHARYLPEVIAVCAHVARAVGDAVASEEIPLVLGGDHSVALGTIGGLARVSGVGGAIWIDAHGDLNTPATTTSGNVHGMALAAALGWGNHWFASEAWPTPALDPRRVAIVGARALDVSEQRAIREHGLLVFTMSEIDRVGIEHVMREAIGHVSGPGFVHVSLDMDVLDPDVAPGVGTPVRGGLTYREAHLALELVAESGVAGSLEVVEINPILDRANTTAATAVELIASALGKTIL